MKININQRHFVGNSETLEGYKGVVERTLDAKSHKPEIDFVMRLGIMPKLEDTLMKGVLEQSGKLASANVRVVLGDYGAGDAWISAMTDVGGGISQNQEKIYEAPEGHVAFLIDGDQFNLNDAYVFDGIQTIATKVSQSNSLLGLCCRDKVSLAADPMLDRARQIEEMYHAFFMGPGRIKPANSRRIDMSNAPAAYRALGDPIPGIYAINVLHEKYSGWQRNLIEDCMSAKTIRLVGIGDTFGVMEAAQFGGSIQTEAVPTRGNPPGLFKLDTIKRKSVEIGKTHLGEGYRNAVINPKYTAKLAEFYPEAEVKSVQELILTGVEQSLGNKGIF